MLLKWQSRRLGRFMSLLLCQLGGHGTCFNHESGGLFLFARTKNLVVIKHHARIGLADWTPTVRSLPGVFTLQLESVLQCFV